MSYPLVISDSRTLGFGKRYDKCIKAFKAEALELEESLDNISAGLLFHKHGVINGSYVVELWELVAVKGSKGNGTIYMTVLCHLADTYNITLVLSLARKGAYGGPVWKQTSSRKRLISFYRRFGFVMNACESDTRLDLPSTMHRNPRHGTNTKSNRRV